MLTTNIQAEAKELRDKTLKNLHKKKKDLEEEKRDFSLAGTHF